MDQLLELVETGVGITEHKTRNYPLAIYYGEDDLPEVDLHAITRTCNTLLASSFQLTLISWHAAYLPCSLRLSLGLKAPVLMPNSASLLSFLALPCA